MNIAFDATAILGPMSKNRGIGNYAISQFKAMLEADKENKYFCVNFFDEPVLGSDTSKFENLEECRLWCGKDRFLSVNPYYINVFGTLIKNFIKNNKIDIFYITSPFDGHVFTYQKEWLEGVRVVATVYDIIPYVMRDVYLADKNTYKWYMGCIDSLKAADRLLVISESVKDDLVSHLDFDEEKIDVIYGAVSEMFQKTRIADGERVSLFTKYGIKDKFIMCTGGDDDRKNIRGLIEAYSRVSQSLTDEYQLVIVCGLSPHTARLYTDMINGLNLNERVILTNYVTDRELLKFYNLASLMAFPSKYEGFGLPVVEAFACGTPVLTSNNSSLGEIAEGAAVLVDPFNLGDITRGLEFALTEADSERNIANGYKKLEIFKWDNVANAVINAINELHTEKFCILPEKKKIAFFTPLPPLESGISDYSVDILNGLSRYFDIDVFIDDNYTPTCVLSDNIKIYNHKHFQKKYNDVIYQMGNSLLHAYMFPHIQKDKGTVVLHDYNMHGVAQAATLRRHNGIKAYGAYLSEDYSKETVDKYIQDLQSGASGLKIFEMEINGFVTNYADKIIVHSDEAREKLLRQNIGFNVYTIRSYAKIEPLPDSVEIKKKLGYSGKEIVIASFGHVHETKRTMLILEAFKRLCVKNRNVKYVFVGKLDTNIEKLFNAFIKSNKLGNNVKITGRVDLDDFKKYIDLTDICLSLRYPYNGETSGSLMRILAKGKCVIVNNIGSFGEIPDGCCVKLPDAARLSAQEEIDCIYEAMERLVSDAGERDRVSKAARKYAEENLDLDIILKQSYECITNQQEHAVNEQTIRNIIDFELPKGYTNHELQKLSKTLAYSIS